VFEASSDNLKTIACHFRGGVGSSTGFRNLLQYSVALKTQNPSPLSFWVGNIEWDSDRVVDLSRQLNFYLKYYDALSPTILIHDPPKATQALKPRQRYLLGQFPDHIDAHQLDDLLLILWDAARTGDNQRRFLYSYRIIEYASFSYLEQKARLQIRQLLSAPHARANIAETTNLVVDELQKSKLEDFQKTEALLRETVKPELLWNEIRENPEAFNQKTSFLGGFQLDALISHDCTEATYLGTRPIENFHRSIRDLRNALAHGKDLRSGGVIAPTAENLEKLRPWVALISVAAAEVMIFRNIL
jgi:hypothetical protein